MTNTPRFLIDTNIFINMKDYTPLDVYPCVWNKIHEMAEAGENSKHRSRQVGNQKV